MVVLVEAEVSERGSACQRLRWRTFDLMGVHGGMEQLWAGFSY